MREGLKTKSGWTPPPTSGAGPTPIKRAEPFVQEPAASDPNAAPAVSTSDVATTRSVPVAPEFSIDDIPPEEFGFPDFNTMKLAHIKMLMSARRKGPDKFAVAFKRLQVMLTSDYTDMLMQTLDEIDRSVAEDKIAISKKSMQVGGQVPQINQSGFIEGPGSPVSDSIPMQAEADSFIVNAPAVQMAGGPNKLNAMVQKTNPKKGTKTPTSPQSINVSNGEYKIGKQDAQKIGYKKLNKMNDAGKPFVDQLDQKGYAGGGIVDDLYEKLTDAETMAENNKMIRTREPDKEVGLGSSAYGPVQITLGLVEDFKKRNPDEYKSMKTYVDKFVKQAHKFLLHGDPSNKRKVVDPNYIDKYNKLYPQDKITKKTAKDSRYDYGGVGELSENEEEYKKLAKSLIRMKLEGIEDDISKFPQAWRGLKPDADWMKRYNLKPIKKSDPFSYEPSLERPEVSVKPAPLEPYVAVELEAPANLPNGGFVNLPEGNTEVDFDERGNPLYRHGRVRGNPYYGPGSVKQHTIQRMQQLGIDPNSPGAMAEFMERSPRGLEIWKENLPGRHY